MKNVLIVALATLAFSFKASAQDVLILPVVPLPLSEIEKQWKDYATPSAPHTIFRQAVGNWTYKAKIWETPTAIPQEGSGTSKVTVILGGRYMQNTIKGKALGEPFEAIGLTGYDNLKQKYETIWIDNMSTGIRYGTGTYEPLTKALTDRGSMSNPVTFDKISEFRKVWTMLDKNHMSFSTYGPGPNETEFRQMEMIFTRKK